MKMPARLRPLLALPLFVTAVLAGGAVRRVQDACGPFTDVTPQFCPYVLEAFYTGITAGTSPTTFSPDIPITRGQSAVFTTKALNQALSRGSRRAALGQWWTPQNAGVLGFTTVGQMPIGCAADGADVWVANSALGSVSRVRASDGRVLEEWPNAEGAGEVMIAMGKVFVSDGLGKLLMIDPTQTPGTPVTAATGLGNATGSVVFDGSRIWTANGSGSISIVTPGATLPWSVTNVTEGFQSPFAVIFDGTQVWVTDQSAQGLFRLNADGSIAQTVPIPGGPLQPTFDGVNIWVPSENANNVTVVQASSGKVMATLVGNGLNVPISAAFDGERVLVTSPSAGGVSLWNAASLAPLGFVSTGNGTAPWYACSDGVNFWITLSGSSQLARF
jgi:S-layer homology domain